MRYLLTILICIQSYLTFSQSENRDQRDSLTSSYLEELVVSANKIEEPRRTVAQQVELVNQKTIRNFNAQTSVDLIQNTGSVAIQKSQQGGGSPILRGFEASRVLLMIDGVRMNNLIYRTGHLQNILTVDNNMLDRAEVLFGPSSTMYGSDALGGVVHFYTRGPELSPDGFKASGNAFVRVGTSNDERTEHLDLNLGGNRFASLTSFTFSNFDNLRMGEKTNPALGEQFGVRNHYVERSADNTSDVLVQNGDPFRQIQSGYKQWDLLQKFLFKQNDRIEHTLNFQYSNSTDVPRYDRLTDPQGSGLRFSEWYYGPQTRSMIAYHLHVKNLGVAADQLTGTVNYQDVVESRHDRRFGNNTRNDRVEKVKVWGLTIDLSKSFGKNSLRYGLDGQFNALRSTAETVNIVTHARGPLSTRYPDGDNNMNMMALYATHTFQVNDRWTLTDGIRLGVSALRAQFIDKTFFPFPYDDIKQNPAFGSGNLGVIYTPSTWKFSFLASTGYRVPNVDDLAKVFDTVTGSSTTTGTLVVPNPDLKPEKTINGDLSVTKFFGDKVRLEGTFFATDFYDAIVIAPTTFNGQSQIIYDGFPANVVSSQNAQRAYIYGYHANLYAELVKNFAVTASYNYTKGRVRSTPLETPLDHIPPAFGRIGFKFSQSRLQLEAFSNFNGWKRIEDFSSSGEDNPQYAPADGMPSWYTFNLRAGYEINKFCTLQAGVDNITDLQYRLFASGINASGRNIFGTLRVRF